MALFRPQLVKELATETVGVNMVLIDHGHLMISVFVTPRKVLMKVLRYEIITTHLAQKYILFHLLVCEAFNYGESVSESCSINLSAFDLYLSW